MSLVLDYNIELYPLRVGDTFSMVLASSLSRGGMTDEDDSQAAWRPGKVSKGIDEDYEYVMYGRVSDVFEHWDSWLRNSSQVYKFDDAADAKV